MGRTPFANTLKYVFTTTSTNFGNMFSMAGASLFLPLLPMLPFQILLTNFLSDLPALAMAGDRLDPEMIAATDLAEALGSIVGLNLLFGIPPLWGCAIVAGAGALPLGGSSHFGRRPSRGTLQTAPDSSGTHS